MSVLTTSRDSWVRRRTGLLVPAILFIISACLFIGAATMSVPASVEPPGPRLFPVIVATGCALVALALTWDLIRNPEPQYTRAEAHAIGIEDGQTSSIPALGAAGLEEVAETERPDQEFRAHSNVQAVLWVLGTLIVTVAALQPVGWLISAAFLFWGVSRGLGSRRPLFDIFVAFAISAIIQLIFAGSLGIHLSPGILEGALPWIR